MTKISPDAVPDRDHGLVYTAHITLEENTMLVDGHSVPLTPGMAVSAEVNMDDRRVIEFLLSPLLRYRDESGRER